MNTPSISEVGPRSRSLLSNSSWTWPQYKLDRYRHTPPINRPNRSIDIKQYLPCLESNCMDYKICKHVRHVNNNVSLFPTRSFRTDSFYSKSPSYIYSAKIGENVDIGCWLWTVVLLFTWELIHRPTCQPLTDVAADPVKWIIDGMCPTILPK